MTGNPLALQRDLPRSGKAPKTPPRESCQRRGLRSRLLHLLSLPDLFGSRTGLVVVVLGAVLVVVVLANVVVYAPTLSIMALLSGERPRTCDGEAMGEQGRAGRA